MLKPKLTVISSAEGIDALEAYLTDKDVVTLDTETTGVHSSAQVIGYSICSSESEAFYVILAAWNKDKQALDYLDTVDASKRLLASLKGKTLVGHNFVFDAAMIESNFKISLIEALHTDTMLLAHLLNENRRVGLKDLGISMFGETATLEKKEMEVSIQANGGFITKSSYELYKADASLIAKYGAKDAWLTYRLFTALLPDLYEQGLDTFFYEETMPLLKGPTYELNTTGLQVDTQKLTQLKNTLKAECAEAKDFIYREIATHTKDKYPGTTKKNGFNIGSSQQLSWLLFGELGLEFGTLTKGGKTICKALGLKLPYTPSAKRDFIHTCQNSVGQAYAPPAIVNGKTRKAKTFKEPWAYIACDKRTLQKLAPKHKWIERLLEYQRKTKLLSTYIEGVEKRIEYGTIRPSFLQHGTTSGRYSSRSPNFQNLPRDDKRIKEIIVSRPGKLFVGADYSQLEPRVFAYYSNDARLLAAFRGEDDFYSVIGMEVYGKSDCTPRKEGSPDAFGIKYKRLRDLSKVIALASTYGATAHQLAPTTGKSIEDTQLDIDNYFERFPGVADMMLEAHKQAKDNGAVYNLFGRPRRIPEAAKIRQIYGDKPHAELPYEARNLLNLAVNHRIQSTGASIVNRAAIKFHENCKKVGINCRIVLQVHDSLVAEGDEQDAEIISLLLQDAMENTIQLEGIRLEALPKIGRNLSEV